MTISSTHSRYICFDDQTKSWKLQEVDNGSILSIASRTQQTSIVFTESLPIRESVDAQEQWSSKLDIPNTFWTKTSFRLNGYFGSSTLPYSRTKPLNRYRTFFRFIIKMLERDKGPNEYQWLEMSFYTRWTEDTSVFICFDAPENFPTDFLATLEARHGGGSSFIQPYVLHVILMHLLIPLYDRSIWDFSKRVRSFEEHRENLTDTDFPGLHDVARHTAHATETVQVGSNVLERMISDCEALATRQANDEDEEVMYQCFQALKLQHSMMLGIAARSISNEKRLSNEINLVFNMMAQKDNGVNLDISQANMEIARATRADSIAMKTIAIVTLTFLPATYVSALLGMNLFNFDPNAHGGHITYSPDLWIYFLSSILLSVVVLAIWWVWQRREDMVEDAKDTGSKTPSRAP